MEEGSKFLQFFAAMAGKFYATFKKPAKTSSYDIASSKQ